MYIYIYARARETATVTCRHGFRAAASPRAGFAGDSDRERGRLVQLYIDVVVVLKKRSGHHCPSRRRRCRLVSAPETNIRHTCNAVLTSSTAVLTSSTCVCAGTAFPRRRRHDRGLDLALPPIRAGRRPRHWPGGPSLMGRLLQSIYPCNWLQCLHQAALSAVQWCSGVGCEPGTATAGAAILWRQGAGAVGREGPRYNRLFALFRGK